MFIINLFYFARRNKNLVETLKYKQMIGEGRYHDWRNDASNTKTKNRRSIREVKNFLNELDKTIKMNQRLNELKVDSVIIETTQN